jgi:hypothetical protein
MDVKSYCETVGAEITGVKQKLLDIRQKAAVETITDTDGFNPMLQQIDSLVANLDKQVENLARECPVDWDSQRAEIDGKLSHVKERWKEVWGVLGESEYGVGGA